MSLVKQHVITLVASVHLCEQSGLTYMQYRRAFMQVLADFGWLILATTIGFFLAFMHSPSCSLVHFQALEQVSCVAFWHRHGSTALFAYDLFLVNITCPTSKVFPNNKWWSTSGNKLFTLCCARHLTFVSVVCFTSFTPSNYSFKPHRAENSTLSGRALYLLLFRLLLMKNAFSISNRSRSFNCGREKSWG